MKRTIIHVWCDNHPEVGAVETVTFSIDHAPSREADLCDTCAHAFRQFTGNARRAFAAGTKLTVVPKRRDPAELLTIRDWAHQQGLTIAARGRIPQHVIDAWDTARRSA